MIEWSEPDYTELRRRMVVGKLYVMVDVWPEHEGSIPCAYCGRKSAPVSPELIALQLLVDPKPGWGNIVTRCRDHQKSVNLPLARVHSEVFHARRRAYGANRALAIEAADSSE